MEAGIRRQLDTKPAAFHGHGPMIKEHRYEMGNPASLRSALRIRNHDVHLHPL